MESPNNNKQKKISDNLSSNLPIILENFNDKLDKSADNFKSLDISKFSMTSGDFKFELFKKTEKSKTTFPETDSTWRRRSSLICKQRHGKQTSKYVRKRIREYIRKPPKTFKSQTKPTRTRFGFQWLRTRLRNNYSLFYQYGQSAQTQSRCPQQIFGY